MDITDVNNSMGKTIQMIALLLSDNGAKPNLVIA